MDAKGRPKSDTDPKDALPPEAPVEEVRDPVKEKERLLQVMIAAFLRKPFSRIF